MSAHILVPLDGSSFGQQALPLAVSLARRTEGVLHLVIVHVPPAPPVKGDLYISRAAQADEEALAAEASYLKELAADLGRSYDLPVETALLSGPIAPALVKYCEERDISLVVMTTHGRGGLSRAWFGSVADALVRTIDVPVLICRPQSAPQKPANAIRLNHLLLPLDGSAEAERAVSRAVEIGTLFNARFTLLQVVSPPTVPTVEMISAPLFVPQISTEQLRQAAQDYLNTVAVPLRERGFQVETTVVIQPQSAAGILEEAAYRQVDLIVMCSHGRSGWQRFALGSVADKVLRGAQVPVLMCRPNTMAPVFDAPAVSEVFV